MDDRNDREDSHEILLKLYREWKIGKKIEDCMQARAENEIMVS